MNGKSPLQISYDQGTLLSAGPSRVEVEGVFGNAVWIWNPRAQAWRREAFRFRSINTMLWQRKLAYSEQASAWTDVRWRGVDLVDLRGEPTNVAKHWWKAKRGVVVMPIGTGKTEVALRLRRENAARQVLARLTLLSDR